MTTKEWLQLVIGSAFCGGSVYMAFLGMNVLAAIFFSFCGISLIFRTFDDK